MEVEKIKSEGMVNVKTRPETSQDEETVEVTDNDNQSQPLTDKEKTE